MISKFPFTDITINDLRILDPEQHLQVSVTSVTRLLKRFNNNSIYDVDAVTMEFREYKSLPDSQLPQPVTRKSALEEFWTLMGELPLLARESNAKRFDHLAGFCKNLLILPHSTADPERLFSILGKIDTSQRSNLQAGTVCDLLSVKINVDQECYKSKELFTPDLLYRAKTATKHSLNNT